MKILNYIIITILLTFPASSKEVKEEEIVSKIKEIVSKHYKKVESRTSDETYNYMIYEAKYKNRMFMIHTPLRNGSYTEKAFKQEGPSAEGFKISINKSKKAYGGGRAIPQTLKSVYWSIYINDIKIKDSFYYIVFEFGNRTKHKFKKDILELVESINEKKKKY